MTKHRKHAKLNIPFCAGLILLCLTLFSTHFTSGLYARYVVKDSAEDGARVAKFDVVVNGEADYELSAVCGKTENDMEYSLTIVNNSEVTVKYSLSVIYSITNGQNDITKAVSAVFSEDNQGILEPNGGSQDHTLIFDVVDWDKITSGLSNDDHELTFGFTVVADVEQVD